MERADNFPCIDLYCHPSLKPYSLASPGNTNNSDAFSEMIFCPLEGYRTSAEHPELRRNLLPFAESYLTSENFLVPSNRKPANVVLNQIFRDNALNFFKNYY